MTDSGDTTYQPTRDASVNATPKKKLIEVSLPLEAINGASAREKSIRHGHPSTLHLWWSRKPLATARAVLFAQLVDDPSSRPEQFPTVAEQDVERARLHDLMARLVPWESTNDRELLDAAAREIRSSNNGEMPSILDPFAGGGSIPLEAQRLGLPAVASDLNPVAVLLEKALVEIPPRFNGHPPVSSTATPRVTAWRAAEGLAEDVRCYGKWLRDEAFKRVGDLYPTITTPGGTEHAVIAWKWTRTVASPNPANPIETPLINTWWLSKKKGREFFIEASARDGEVIYDVVEGKPEASAQDGTITSSGATVVGDGSGIEFSYIRQEAAEGRMGTALVAVIAEAKRGRLYLSPTDAHRAAADIERPEDPACSVPLPDKALGFRIGPYGFRNWSDLFTNRQLKTLLTLSDLVEVTRARVLQDALQRGMEKGEPLESGGRGAVAYADAVAVYLALGISRFTDYSNSFATWDSSRDSATHLFTRQAISMIWSFVEVNPFSSSSGNFLGQLEWVSKALERLPADGSGTASISDAASRDYTSVVVSTDPPYYDYIGYADLADYFYVWLRRSLSGVLPSVFATMLAPKSEELVANPYRHGGKDGAEKFFVDGFNGVFSRIRETSDMSAPMTVYYAYKQQDTKSDGAASSGWHTVLTGLIEAGWEVSATWPVRSELANRPRSQRSNALASSIVLACRPRPESAEAISRRAFVSMLKAELPDALRKLMQGSIAPVDLAQAAIGPGISVFSRYSRVREADGSDMSVRDALLLINATLDEVLGEQESDFDPDTRFAVKWYRQFGWDRESSGTADQLARSSDTSPGALERGGIFEAKGGKARLLPPSQLEGHWDPAADERVSVWEATVRLAAVMAKDGADMVAELLPSVQTRVNLDAVKELGFLLFHEAEKKRDTKDANLFNGLVSAWGDVNEQARKHAGAPRAVQQAFDFDEEEG